MKFDAIIFDLFGTLIDNFTLSEYKRVISQIAKILSLPAEKFFRFWRETFDQRVRGDFKTFDENIEYISKLLELPVDEHDIQKALKVRFDYTKRELKPRVDAIDVLKKIKFKGLKIGLITDCSFEVPILWIKTPFAPYFDATTFSCSVNMKKPDPRIYIRTCDRLGVKSQRCLYIGDGSSQELTGASHVGMCPVLIRVPYEKDALRINEDDWKGQKITSLREVLNLVV